MNERIKELNLQALCAVMNGPDPTGDVFNKMYIPSEFTKKFAELIVRECSKVNNQYVGWRIGDIDLDMVYKEHFGVEE